MVGEPQVTMRVTSQIWQVVFASQTLPVFCFSLLKKAQYVVVFLVLKKDAIITLLFNFVHCL
jgi:hypothetical protein